MIRFGGPVFLRRDENEFDPEKLADAYKMKGYTAAYAPDLSITQTEEIRLARRAFEKKSVMIAEAGFWQNLMDLDPKTRAANRKKMTETLALAEELGAKCAVDTCGTYSYGGVEATYDPRNFSDEMFEEAVSMARTFIDAVKPKTAYFTYEIFPFNLVDSIDSIEKLIIAVDRDKFGVHLDLTNMINCPRLYWNNARLSKECAKRLGDKIVSAHVKDIQMRAPALSVILEEVRPGLGVIDYRAYASALHELPHEIPFMMEHLQTEEEYDLAAAHIRAEVKEIGINI